MTANRLFNRRAFELRIGDDPQLLREIIELFIELQPQRMQALQHAVATADVAKTQAMAHMLKGAFGSVSMDSLAELAGGLEVCAENGDMTSCSEAMDELVRQFERVMIELSALEQELGHGAALSAAR
jgi:HPt (histidine-containing phosphotransfer) domain-containing protein